MTRVGAAVLLIAFLAAGTAFAQKPGGVLQVAHRDSPASMSTLEEVTISTVAPMMAVFNNLVMFDQHVPQNTLQSIVPELATSWSWNEDDTALTFRLREGVRWHDGHPFTAKDVQCTWDMLLGKSASKFRINPRKSWYWNLDRVTTNGDLEAIFHLKQPQPAMIALLASGYSPVYPCHVPPQDMRQHPIGTGPFKFVSYKPNESIRLTRNPNYWRPNRPYLDGIEWTIISNRSTALLAFVAGKLDMTFPYEVTVPLLRDIESQAPEAICELRPRGVSSTLIVNRNAPPFDNPDLRRAMALTLDRKAFIDVLSGGQGDIGGAMLPPPEGLWGMPPERLRALPGYDPDVQKNRGEAREIMQRLGYGPDNPLASVAGLRGSPGALAYSATKWALRGMTKAAAIDLAPRKIRVNSVHPGPIDTEMLNVRTPEQNRHRLQLVPMKRMGTAEEVAALVLFLLSDESGYITGAEVAIDGGASL